MEDKIKKLFLLILLPFITFAQPEMIVELRISLINYSSPWNFTFTLDAVGARWDENYDLTEYYETVADNITNNPPLEITADFDHILDPFHRNPIFAVGLYKIYVTAGIQSGHNAYFYMDWRTSDYSSCLDVHFRYDVSNERFRNSDDTQTIDYTYQTLWDLTANLIETSDLENYWSNTLVLIDRNNDNPNLVWGPHPSFTTTHFYIYRAVAEIPINPKEELIYYPCAIRSASTYQFTDTEFEFGGSPTHVAYYYVKAYNSSNETFSSSSNLVTTDGEYVPHKIGSDLQNEIQPLDFDLKQNYPNPFNPSTIIAYNLPENNFVNLKVFDLLGREVVTLVNESKESGSHLVEFNAEGLPSGIYLYKIQSGSFLKIRKMMLQK